MRHDNNYSRIPATVKALPKFLVLIISCTSFSSFQVFYCFTLFLEKLIRDQDTRRTFRVSYSDVYNNGFVYVVRYKYLFP